MGRRPEVQMQTNSNVEKIASEALASLNEMNSKNPETKKNPKKERSLSSHTLLWCQRIAELDTIDGRSAEGAEAMIKKATNIYLEIRPSISKDTATRYVRKLFADKQVARKIEAIRTAKGLSYDIILADRQELHTKIMQIANIILEDELTDLQTRKQLKEDGIIEGPIFEPKSSLLHSGRLMQLNVWLLEHARTFGFHPSITNNNDAKTQNLVIMSDTDEVTRKVLSAVETLKTIESKGDSKRKSSPDDNTNKDNPQISYD